MSWVFPGDSFNLIVIQRVCTTTLCSRGLKFWIFRGEGGFHPEGGHWTVKQERPELGAHLLTYSTLLLYPKVLDFIRARVLAKIYRKCLVRGGQTQIIRI